jgi:osmoprotectant transport system permease protein
MNSVVAAGPVIPNFGQGSKCEQTNGWWCTDWLHAHWGDTLQPALFQHIELSLIAVSIGFALAFLLALVGVRYRLLDAPIGVFADFLYTLPSLALFQWLVPLTGLTVTTVEIALVSYTLLILSRNMVEGLRAATDSGPRLPRSTTLRDALALLIGEHAQTIAVTDDAGTVVGSVTRDDLLR